MDGDVFPPERLPLLLTNVSLTKTGTNCPCAGVTATSSVTTAAINTNPGAQRFITQWT